LAKFAVLLGLCEGGFFLCFLLCSGVFIIFTTLSLESKFDQGCQLVVGLSGRVGLDFAVRYGRLPHYLPLM